MWIFFCQNLFRQQKRFRIHIKGCKWVKYQYNVTSFFFILFVSLRQYLIVWICVCHKKNTHLDTFLNKLCSKSTSFSVFKPKEGLRFFKPLCRVTSSAILQAWSVLGCNSITTVRFRGWTRAQHAFTAEVEHSYEEEVHSWQDNGSYKGVIKVIILSKTYPDSFSLQLGLPAFNS